MINNYRTAIAVTVALALSACATTENDNEPHVIAAKVTTPAVDTIASMKDLDESLTTTKDQIPLHQPEMFKQNETLLYGAMTKYELTHFVDAVITAELQETLEAETSMTVFAPTNQAIELAQFGTESDVAAILKGHIILGSMDLSALTEAVAQSDMPVKFMSTAGTELTVYVMGDKVKISGSNGTLATITQADMMQSNGVMHQINSVIK